MTNHQSSEKVITYFSYLVKILNFWVQSQERLQGQIFHLKGKYIFIVQLNCHVDFTNLTVKTSPFLDFDLCKIMLKYLSKLKTSRHYAIKYFPHQTHLNTQRCALINRKSSQRRKYLHVIVYLPYIHFQPFSSRTLHTKKIFSEIQTVFFSRYIFH